MSDTRVGETQAHQKWQEFTLFVGKLDVSRIWPRHALFCPFSDRAFFRKTFEYIPHLRLVTWDIIYRWARRQARRVASGKFLDDFFQHFIVVFFFLSCTNLTIFVLSSQIGLLNPIALFETVTSVQATQNNKIGSCLMLVLAATLQVMFQKEAVQAKLRARQVESRLMKNS